LVWPDGRRTDFTTELNVAPTADPSRYTWQVTYTDQKGPTVRGYELVVVDAAAGAYEIDEKNGIRLSMTLLGQTLRSAYVVQGTQVVTTGRMERTPAGDRIVSELLSLDATPANPSGGGSVPEVTALRPKVLQRAVLTRVPPK